MMLEVSLLNEDDMGCVLYGYMDKAQFCTTFPLTLEGYTLYQRWLSRPQCNDAYECAMFCDWLKRNRPEVGPTARYDRLIAVWEWASLDPERARP